MTDPVNAGLINSIRDGVMDQHLDTLSKIISDRQALIEASLATQLKEGSRIKLCDAISPKYMAGQICIVKKISEGRGGKTKISVEAEDKHAARKYAFGFQITPSLIGEILDD